MSEPIALANYAQVLEEVREQEQRAPIKFEYWDFPPPFLGATPLHQELARLVRNTWSRCLQLFETLGDKPEEVFSLRFHRPTIRLHHFRTVNVTPQNVTERILDLLDTELQRDEYSEELRARMAALLLHPQLHYEYDNWTLWSQGSAYQVGQRLTGPGGTPYIVSGFTQGSAGAGITLQANVPLPPGALCDIRLQLEQK